MFYILFLVCLLAAAKHKTNSVASAFFKTNPVPWTVINNKFIKIAACKFFVIAEKIFGLNPLNSSQYMGLANFVFQDPQPLIKSICLFNNHNNIVANCSQTVKRIFQRRRKGVPRTIGCPRRVRTPKGVLHLLSAGNLLAPERAKFIRVTPLRAH